MNTRYLLFQKLFFITFVIYLLQACSPAQEENQNPISPSPITNQKTTRPQDNNSQIKDILPDNETSLPEAENNLIIGGEKVKRTQNLATHIVSLINTEQGTLCTATILSEDLLLTAAHCLTGSTQAIKISFSLRVNKTNLRSINSYKTHPYWNRSQSDKNAFDIGIIYFPGGLPKGYAKVNLLPSTYQLQNNQAVILAGYGRTSGHKSSEDGYLHSVLAPIYNAKFSETEILIDQTNNKGACHGDSGGPAFIQLSDGRLLYWGITSRGYGPNGPNCLSYSVYTKVMAHRIWINMAAKELKKN